MVIWKYEIPVNDFFEISMPKGADVLCVQMQGETPCIWVKIYEGIEEGVEKREFAIVGTGQSFNDYEYYYVGTFQNYAGMLVWHLFERWSQYSEEEFEGQIEKHNLHEVK